MKTVIRTDILRIVLCAGMLAANSSMALGAQYKGGNFSGTHISGPFTGITVIKGMERIELERYSPTAAFRPLVNIPKIAPIQAIADSGKIPGATDPAQTAYGGLQEITASLANVPDNSDKDGAVTKKMAGYFDGKKTEPAGIAAQTQTQQQTPKADNWKHASLQGTEGTTINVDYVIGGNGKGNLYAESVWINVNNPKFADPKLSAKAVVINYYKEQRGRVHRQVQSQYIVPMARADGGFTVQLPERIPLSESWTGYGYNFEQEITVVIPDFYGPGKDLWVKGQNGMNIPFQMTWF